MSSTENIVTTEKKGIAAVPTAGAYLAELLVKLDPSLKEISGITRHDS